MVITASFPCARTRLVSHRRSMLQCSDPIGFSLRGYSYAPVCTSTFAAFVEMCAHTYIVWQLQKFRHSIQYNMWHSVGLHWIDVLVEKVDEVNVCCSSSLLVFLFNT